MKISKTSTLYRFTKNIKAMIGLIIIFVFIIIAITAPLISMYDPYEIKTGPLYSPVSKDHLFGTDNFGRDIYARVIYGSRISLYVSISVGIISAVVGVLVGIAAGYFGGKFDIFVMRIIDILLSIPIIVIGITAAAILNPSINTVIIALVFGRVPGFVRIVRSKTLSIKNETYVRAAEAIDETKIVIMLRYILPNLLGIVLVQMALTMSIAIIVEAGLSYLGLGTQPPATSWGLLLSDATSNIFTVPKTLAIIPGIFIMVLVLGFNFLGDGLRDIYDPKMR
jgi:peptide/nickel transport system permease protein